jgi:hypothetical protein
VLLALVSLSLQQAQAHLLDPIEFATFPPLGSGTDEQNYLIASDILPGTSRYLGKYTAGGPFENGAINVSQYVTITVVTGSAWNISWNVTGSGFTLDGVLITASTATREELYGFYGVSADEALFGSGTVTFDNPASNISHISFFGSPGGSQVPDCGRTVMLLGAALGALGMARRFVMNS